MRRCSVSRRRDVGPDPDRSSPSAVDHRGARGAPPWRPRTTTARRGSGRFARGSPSRSASGRALATAAATTSSSTLRAPPGDRIRRRHRGRAGARRPARLRSAAAGAAGIPPGPAGVSSGRPLARHRRHAAGLPVALDRGHPHLVLRGHTGGVERVAFAPDGWWLASCGSDGTVRRWPLTAAAGARRSILYDWGHPVEGFVSWMVLAPDGRFLVTTGDADSARLVPLDGSPPRSLGGFDQRVLRAAVDPQGRRVAVPGYVGGRPVVRVWDLATGGITDLEFDEPRRPASVPAAGHRADARRPAAGRRREPAGRGRPGRRPARDPGRGRRRPRGRPPRAG